MFGGTLCKNRVTVHSKQHLTANRKSRYSFGFNSLPTRDGCKTTNMIWNESRGVTLDIYCQLNKLSGLLLYVSSFQEGRQCLRAAAAAAAAVAAAT